MTASPTNLPDDSQIFKILKLLEVTYCSSETEQIRIAQEQLQELSKDFKNFTEILFKCLSMQKINDKEMPIQLRQSIAINLRNILLKNQLKLNQEELFLCIKNIVSLIFEFEKYPHNLSGIFNNLLTILLSSDLISQQSKYIEELFQIVLNKIKNVNEQNFIETTKKAIDLSTSFLTSSSTNQTNYENLLNNYCIIIIDIIFANGKNFILPEKNLCDIEYIILLTELYEGIYNILSNMRTLYLETQVLTKNISIILFNKYYKFSYELILLSPQLIDKNPLFPNNNNAIIIFSKDDNFCNILNKMKSKVIQFLSYTIQISCSVSDTNFLEVSNNKNPNNDINDKNMELLIIDLIKIIIKSFEDILNNNEKFNIIRDYKNENLCEENGYNSLLFQICVFLTRTFIRQPIKNQFNDYINLFLLNILFPLLITVNSENINDDNYHNYLNDIISDFKMKNFRTAGTFLINKICDNFYETKNFILSFIIQLLNFAINNGNIENNKMNYNIYLEHKDKFNIDKCDFNTKIDFALLILLLLKKDILRNNLMKNNLRLILLSNQIKLNEIPNEKIKIKIFKIYSNYINLFEFSDNKNENKSFIQNAINYLLNNISIDEKNNLSQSISYEASQSINDIIEYCKLKEDENKNLITSTFLTSILSENFKKIIEFIQIIENEYFFNIIEHIIEKIKISNRDDVFLCLKKITEKYENIKEKENFSNQYFKILNSFLNGVNKLDKNNKSEILLFEEIFSHIMQLIKDITTIPDYDELINNFEDYMKLTEKINEQSINILFNIINIIEKENSLSDTCYSFISTFLKILNKNKNLEIEKIITEIIKIILKCFTLQEEFYENITRYTLLLTMQLLNNNYTDLNIDNFTLLISNSFQKYQIITENDRITGIDSNKKIINQIVLTNVSLGFIFNPEKTLEILTNKIENNITDFDKFCSFLLTITNISDKDYIILLNKIIILGICSILNNNKCNEYLSQNLKKKSYLVQIFITLVNQHKIEQTNQINKIMKKETDCNFIENSSEDEEDEEYEDDDDINELKENTENILYENENIKNSDEYKFFSDIIKRLKSNESDLMNNITNNGQNLNAVNTINELMVVRNINIKYKGKNFKVPRKTVRIIKKNGA